MYKDHGRRRCRCIERKIEVGMQRSMVDILVDEVRARRDALHAGYRINDSFLEHWFDTYPSGTRSSNHALGRPQRVRRLHHHAARGILTRPHISLLTRNLGSAPTNVSYTSHEALLAKPLGEEILECRKSM